MEIVFLIVATLIFITMMLHYTSHIVETREGFIYFICGQILWGCAGIGAGRLIIDLSKLIFH